jgi:gluconate kinase
MTNINNFIKQDNLEKMNNIELMELWGFLLSDHNRIYLIDRIQKILDDRSNKNV